MNNQISLLLNIAHMMIQNPKQKAKQKAKEEEKNRIDIFDYNYKCKTVYLSGLDTRFRR